VSDYSAGGYPPPPPPPGFGPPPQRRRNPAAWIAVAAAAVLVVTAGVGAFVLLNRDEPAVVPVAVKVTLEPAADPGADPFLAEVEVSEVAVFPDTVLAVADTTMAAMATDAASGTLTTTGTVPALYGGRPDGTGLYGGSGDQAVCDIDQLASFLEANPDKAAAWASVRRIAPGEIRAYLTGLTPVALLTDTAVTNYGFAGGVATARQSVLQAGTAVLVDDTGLPVVRCACGNPLTAPQVTNLPGAEFLGTPWAGFDPTRAVVVTAGDRVGAFTLVDLETGASFQRPVGAVLAAEPAPEPLPEGPRTIVVASGGVPGDPSAAGQIFASTDGIAWRTILEAPGTLAGVAVSDGLTVAVGSDPGGAGTVRTTADGVTWTDPVTVADPLQKVGYGDGLWMAVGTTAAGTEAVVYTSPDAVTWTRSPSATGITAALSMEIGSVAYGPGRWQFSYSARSEGGRGFAPLGVAASTDNGQTWESVVPAGEIPGGLTENPIALDLAFGEQWAMVGFDVTDVIADTGSSVAQSGTSADGVTWSVQAIGPVDTYLDSLAWAGAGEWFARGGVKGGFTGAATDHAVYSSTDLITWNRLGSPAGAIGDIAVSWWPASAATPAAPSASAAPTAEAPAPVPGACVDGGLQFTLSRETSFPTCEAMIAQWRSFTATGGTETRQGDWICRLAGSLEAGECALSDTDIVFTVSAATAGAGPAPAPAAPAAPAGAVQGDLGLSVPMTKPACDGTGIVLLFASVTPSTYAQEIQQALDEFPNSSYLRTDQACPSLTQATAAGDPIYAVYRVAGPNAASVCAAVASAGGSAYGKWLDNSTPPEARVDC
jgi:hypothetical protein